MTYDEAASILKKMYNEAPRGEQALSIHLFAIKYAKNIENMTPAEIAERAGLSRSYGVEINKGRNLAKYVELKSEPKNLFDRIFKK
jgi:hypothetical protein